MMGIKIRGFRHAAKCIESKNVDAGQEARRKLGHENGCAAAIAPELNDMTSVPQARKKKLEEKKQIFKPVFVCNTTPPHRRDAFVKIRISTNLKRQVTVGQAPGSLVPFSHVPALQYARYSLHFGQIIFRLQQIIKHKKSLCGLGTLPLRL